MIGLLDVDGKLPNLALMKISSYYKSLGEEVEFVDFNHSSKYDKIYASTLFTWNRNKCLELQRIFEDRIHFGGTGWDFKEIDGELVQISHTELPKEIEYLKPDYDLYTSEIVYKRICRGIGKKENKIKKAEVIANMGIGFTSRGCVRNCKFCVVRQKEGAFKEVNSISQIINPRSNVLTLYDNNLTADPHCIDKLKEIRDRGLIVDISQGIDVRLLTEEKAKALSEVKHLRSIHYAWDLIESEKQILEGVSLLSNHIKTYRHMCFILVGYNTTFEEDMYRFRKLREFNVSPFVMVYNKNSIKNKRLQHFARWVNSRIYKVCSFEEYEPWVNAQAKNEFVQLEFKI